MGGTRSRVLFSRVLRANMMGLFQMLVSLNFGFKFLVTNGTSCIRGQMHSVKMIRKKLGGRKRLLTFIAWVRNRVVHLNVPI